VSLHPMLRFASVSALVLAPSVAAAYPISPVTLWELVEKADLIVLAETKVVEPMKERDRAWNDADAVLKVLETWHGPAFKEVRVPFSSRIICPAPPRYVAGEMVLAFLEKDPKSGRYETIGLSYGALYPPFDELDAWKDAVSAAIELRSRGAPSHDERRRWLVEVAARRPTRWQGLYELDPGSDEMHSYYDREERPRFILTSADKAILARGIVTEPSLDEELVAILRLLRDHPSPEVDAVAVAAADRLLDEERAYFYDDLVELTLERFGKRALRPRSKNDDRGLSNDPLIAGVPRKGPWAKNVWSKMRPHIFADTSAVTFPGERSPRVRGTGSETPP
jgi:hypothetical protein